MKRVVVVVLKVEGLEVRSPLSWMWMATELFVTRTEQQTAAKQQTATSPRRAATRTTARDGQPNGDRRKAVGCGRISIYFCLRFKEFKPQATTTTTPPKPNKGGNERRFEFASIRISLNSRAASICHLPSPAASHLLYVKVSRSSQPPNLLARPSRTDLAHRPTAKLNSIHGN